jgi:radical SAM protein with 4Fe4S-binding SPASM domain
MKYKHPNFNTVAIETYSKCDNSCPFCPVTYQRRKDRFLETDTIISILTQLRTLKFKGHIHWHFFSEPLLDKRLPSLVKLAAETVPYCYQVVSTNGNHLTVPLLKQLKEAGVNNIVINLYKKMNLKPIIKAAGKMSDSAWSRGKGMVNNLRPFGLSVLDKMFYFKKESCANRKYRMFNRGGTIEKFLPALKEPIAKKCVRPFRQLIINAWGDVVVCCGDHNAQVVFGNIKKDKLIDIWQSKLANHYRERLHHSDRASLKLCKLCDYDGGCLQLSSILNYVKSSWYKDK